MAIMSSEINGKLINQIVGYLRNLSFSTNLSSNHEKLQETIESLTVVMKDLVNDDESVYTMASSKGLLEIFQEFDSNGVLLNYIICFYTNIVDKKFENYLNDIKSNGYFDACTLGSQEYWSKLDAARKKFLNQSVSSVSETDEGVEDMPLIERISKAESLKEEGNQKLNARLFDEAIDLYTRSINLNPNCAVYYSNRAAAYTALKDHNSALADAMKAIELDPLYSKAYLRLGLAYYNLGQYQTAIDAGYNKALELDASNQSIKELIHTAEEALGKVQDSSTSTKATPNLDQNVLSQMGNYFNSPSFLEAAQNFMKQPNFKQIAENFIKDPQYADIFNQILNDGGALQKFSELQKFFDPK